VCVCVCLGSCVQVVRNEELEHNWLRRR